MVTSFADSHGYTSFAVRLDNVSGVVWGGPNVLAVYVDATVFTGWFYEVSSNWGWRCVLYQVLRSE